MNHRLQLRKVIPHCAGLQSTQLAYTKASAKLLRYFNGANDAKERMERTTPTLVRFGLVFTRVD
jgi:hypothetical protein